MAFSIGIAPDRFWSMTPWQLRCCVKGYQKQWELKHNHDAWMMWHNAVLQRGKTIRPLDDFFIGDSKKVKGIDEHAIIARLKAYQDQKDRKEEQTRDGNGNHTHSIS